jgi:glycosyltransferase involved in cell wall biosynthesis
MHLTALVESEDHVCCRYRLEAFRPFLERAGHTLSLHPLPRKWWRFWRLCRDLRGASVVIQRHLFPAWQLGLLRRSVAHLLFDFDDAVFLRDSYAPKGLHSPRRLRRFTATVRACDAVLAGNTFLFDQAARWAGVHRVHHIPTCVDPERYPLADHVRANGGVELVWVGSSSTLRGLQAVAPMLEELGRQVHGLRLRLICDRFLHLQSLPVVPCPWTQQGESKEIARGDIGMSWIPADDWSRGKCGLKVLQYMAAGLPVVANPVGVQAEMVRDGENGYLADSPREWVEAIRRLAHDPPLRRRMGEAGRRRVEADFSVASGAARWVRVLEGLSHSLAPSGASLSKPLSGSTAA